MECGLFKIKTPKSRIYRSLDPLFRRQRPVNFFFFFEFKVIQVYIASSMSARDRYIVRPYLKTKLTEGDLGVDESYFVS